MTAEREYRNVIGRAKGDVPTEALKVRAADPELPARMIKGARAAMAAKLSRSGRIRDLDRERRELFSREHIHGH